VDHIIPEPDGGAHSDGKETALRIKEYLVKEIRLLSKKSATKLVKQRQKRFGGWEGKMNAVNNKLH
jgi:acetyl-CoA carboxylase carboxyl transferase subunit alpha